MDLVAKKKELLRQMMARKGIAVPNQAAGIVRREDLDTYPLSFAQRRLWFLNRLEPESPFYNMPAVLRIEGAPDVAVLRRVLRQLVLRHESLRYVFKDEGAGPVAHLLPPEEIALESYSIHDKAALRKHIDAFTLQPFDLDTGPLLRMQLLTVSAGEHYLLINQHHIISDGWSQGVLVSELTTLYSAYVRGESGDVLPKPKLQYADYAAWNHRPERQEVHRKQLTYWLKQLQDLPEKHTLPLDFPRPARQTYDGALVPLSLDPGLSAGLEDLAAEAGTTVNVVLTALFAVLLGRLSGSTETVLGMPIANRNRPELEGLIGFFVNTLVMRIPLGDMSFRKLLTTTHRLNAEAAANQDVPFEQLVEALDPPRDQSHAPLFQIAFVMQQDVPQPPQLPDLKLSFERGTHQISKYDLTLMLSKQGACYTGDLEYNTSLFSEETIQRTASAFQRLCKAALEDPDRPVNRLNVLSDEQRTRLTRVWNHTAARLPFKPLHFMFEEIARRHPEAPALADDTGEWTYGQLNSRANRLARLLVSQGAGPGKVVAVCLTRGNLIPQALLAILKSGAAYLPLDPETPATRLRFMLEDAEPTLIIAENDVTGTDIPRINPETTPTFSDKDLSRKVLEAQPAYIIYTSGSTGRPKGTVITHAGAANSIASDIRAFGLESGHRTLHAASFAFDAATSHLFMALCSGASVRLIDPLAITAPGGSRHFSEHGITHFTTATSTLAAVEPIEAPDLVHIASGGDFFSPGIVVNQHRTGRRIINIYGPTETAITATMYPCSEKEVKPAIGKPIAGLSVYVLDHLMEPVPIGAPGMLHVGGVGLAQGYLRRPGLTAAAFLPNPFATDLNDTRLYRTGDLVRFLADGNLDFLGRADHQLKWRGYRIETEEIAAVLERHPQVFEARVLLRPGDETLLVAYIRPSESPTSDEEDAALRQELNRHLRQELPAYMRPQRLLFLDQLPRTVNGKMDDKALIARPLPDEAPRGNKPLTTPNQHLIADLFKDTLGLAEKPGADADFFELGGHSLPAAGIPARLRKIAGVELPLRVIFDNPTVAQLAEALEAFRSQTVLPPILPVPHEGVLSFNQQRLLFLHNLEPESAAYNITTGLHLDGPLDIDALQTSLTHILARHEVLRTTFRERGGEAYTVTAPPKPFSLEIRDVAIDRLDALIEAERVRPFDLKTGPVFRALLLRTGSERFFLLAGMHHIVADGWAAGQIVDELTALYSDLVEGRKAEEALPPPAVQYGDYAVWQREHYLQIQERHKQWWLNALEGVPTVLELPLDHARRGAGSSADALHFQLSRSRTTGLHSLSSDRGATLFMTLLAALGVLLWRMTGRDDFLIGSPTANRGQTELEPMIGFFVNLLPLRLTLSHDISFTELVDQVRETALESFARQDLPFEVLVEELTPERNLDRAPLCQVMFVLQNTPLKQLALPGLTVRHRVIEETDVKVDLNLTMTETGDGMTGVWRFNAGLFDRPTIERLDRRFADLIDVILKDPTQPVGDLFSVPTDIAPPDEVAPDRPPVHTQVEAVAGSRPNEPALDLDDAVLTYRELNERANRLAHGLIAAGIQPGDRVALLTEEDPKAVIGMLGVLKAGAAFVCPNTSDPRLAEMLRDVQPKALLVWPAAREPDIETAVVLNPEDEAFWRDYPMTNPDLPPAKPDLPVYLTFTSGSTGTPKAIVQSTRSWRQFVGWIAEAFDITPKTRAANLTRNPFDSCYYESFAALTKGAVLCPGPKSVKTDPARAARWLSEKRIHFAKCVPGFLRGMLAELKGDAPSSLTHMLLAGEALPVELARDWYAAAPQTPLFNLYGPSEAILTSVHEVSLDDLTRTAVPLGHAIQGRRLMLLDERGRPCPEGMPGEIVIHSDYLTLGYWNRPEETAKRFGRNGDKRFYRTGDLGMINSDGTLRFLGRKDHQVKIRGVRVELEEIERVLEQHTAVTEAAVVLQHVHTPDAFIAAFVVLDRDIPEPMTELIPFIETHLPLHMRPAGLRVLDKLPRTASGKRNRKALPQVSAEDLTGSGVHIAPRGPDEAAIADIWSDILKRKHLSVRDNFFHLGGHSLTAGRVLARIREQEQVPLTLQDFFREPTVEGLAARMATLRREHGGFDLPPLTRRPDHITPPLSFSQQRLWFLSRFGESASAATAYNLSVALQLDGGLDLDTLNWSLSQVIRRHESLRTVFPADENGKPYQRILPAEPVSLSVEVISPESLDDTLQEAAAEQFQLENGRLLSMRLLQTQPDRHILVMVMHHIISDGWSAGIFVQELGLLYSRRGRSETEALKALPPLPVQYADFAWWQHNHLAGKPLERQKQYWLNKLAGAPVLHELITDRPRHTEMSFDGAACHFELDAAITHALIQLGRDEGATLFMVLQSVFALLIARYSGEDDIVLGSPIANRNQKPLEPLIGFFVNTLVLRTQISPNATFRDLLQHTRETSLEAFENQDLPFEQLVDAMDVPRNMSHTPLFQIVFVLQNADLPELQLPGLHVKALEMEQQTAKFDLGLSMTERDGKLFGYMEYNTHLFDGETVRRLIDHYGNLLRSAAENPDHRVDLLPMISRDERALVLETFSRNTRDVPLETPVHRIFEHMAARHPEANALVHKGVAWTYDRLNRAANQLAHRLRREGVQPEDIVGFCLPRCPELVMTMLAVLKAGGAYMPLDPAYPRERLDYMLQDSGLKYLVTFEPADNPPEGVTNILLRNMTASDPETNLDLNPHPENAAFIIYTSGSTGKPKGTVLVHEALTNTILSDIDYYETGPGERFMQTTSFSFDAGTSHTFMTLCAGGALHIHNTDDILDPVRFEEVMTTERITLSILSPSALAALPKLHLPHLRLLGLGGEALPDDVKDAWADDVRLVNVYGPTEGTVSTSREICRTGLPATIGRPIPNQEVYVLDRQFKPCPMGAPGELMIGGTGVARGYLNRPKLTAARFRPHPFSDKPGARLYHSGDRARFLADGRLDFLGRLDNQVKLRGFRIEIGEIEATLRREEQVMDAAVLLRPRPNSNDQMLAAYLACTDIDLDIQVLTERLRTQLPAFMIPAVFVPLERLPLTPNGKLDTARLPTDLSTFQNRKSTPPRDEIEQALADIFNETLGLPADTNQDVFDNFFQLGGHSLLAVQVIARVRRRFEVEPSLRLLFQDPTIAGLADWIRSIASTEAAWAEAPEDDEEELEF